MRVEGGGVCRIRLSDYDFLDGSALFQDENAGSEVFQLVGGAASAQYKTLRTIDIVQLVALIIEDVVNA